MDNTGRVIPRLEVIGSGGQPISGLRAVDASRLGDFAGRLDAAEIRYLLRYRVADLLGRKPSPDDSRILADCFQPKFAKLIRGDQRQLADTLLSVCDLAAEDRKVAGGKGVVLGSAALGVLLNDPEAAILAFRRCGTG